MHSRIRDIRSRLAPELESYITGSAGQLLSFEPWGTDVARRLAGYTSRGKLLRGVFVGVGELLYRASVSNSSIKAGAAMELLQSFLLVHDDIMDDDDLRRGEPAIHAQYRQSQGLRPGADTRQYGLSQGICVGDVAAFLAVHLLSEVVDDPKVSREIVSLTSREIIAVGLAQMQDVHHGYVESSTPERIIAVYTYKTGRYTFSLPFAVGALIAGQERGTLEPLMELGEHLGRIFQLKDDEIGLFGDSETTGKPVGSDIRENKQTLLRWELFNRSGETVRLQNLFGSQSVSEDDIRFVREETRRCGALDAVAAAVDQEAARARSLIPTVAPRSEGQEILTWLLDFNLSRSS